MSATCKHERYAVTVTRAFMGAVSHDENRAAHGCIVDTHVCLWCGAERAQNINGSHTETGAWSPSVHARVVVVLSALDLATEAMASAPAPAPVVRADGLTASLDEEGYICLTGSMHREDAALTLPPDWLAAARARRLAILRCNELACELEALVSRARDYRVAS